MRSILASLLIICGTFASADICEELWYTKNLILDRAGHCFSSALGRANFDNDDCVEANPTLRDNALMLYNDAWAKEVEYRCDIDTSVYRELDIQQVALRRQMIVLPIREGLRYDCMEFQGDEEILRLGPSEDAPQSGLLRPGDDLVLIYMFEGDWAYVNLEGDSGAGWAELDQLDYKNECIPISDSE